MGPFGPRWARSAQVSYGWGGAGFGVETRNLRLAGGVPKAAEKSMTNGTSPAERPLRGLRPLCYDRPCATGASVVGAAPSLRRELVPMNDLFEWLFLFLKIGTQAVILAREVIVLVRLLRGGDTRNKKENR